jgi:hypothetical protein
VRGPTGHSHHLTSTMRRRSFNQWLWVEHVSSKSPRPNSREPNGSRSGPAAGKQTTQATHGRAHTSTGSAGWEPGSGGHLQPLRSGTQRAAPGESFSQLSSTQAKPEGQSALELHGCKLLMACARNSNYAEPHERQEQASKVVRRQQGEMGDRLTRTCPSPPNARAKDGRASGVAPPHRAVDAVNDVLLCCSSWYTALPPKVTPHPPPTAT